MSSVRSPKVEVKQLNEFTQATPDAHLCRKAQVIRLRSLGKSVPEIAKIINMSERTIYRSPTSYREKNLKRVFIDSRRGTRPKISEKFLD